MFEDLSSLEMHVATETTKYQIISMEVTFGGSRTRYLSVVSSTDYSKLKLKDVSIYCSSGDLETARLIARKTAGEKVGKIVRELAVLRSGLVIVVSPAVVYVYAPPFGSATAYWAEQGDTLIVSDSSTLLARSIKAGVQLEAIAAHLIESLPFYPFIYEGVWKNVKTVHPYDALKISQNGYAAIPIWTLSGVGNSDSSRESIRDRLVKIVSGFAHTSESLSCDLSGGVDSASIVYLLKALNLDFQLFHARSDSTWSSDTEWATKISLDLFHHLEIVDSVGSTSLAFEADAVYPGRTVPDAPIYWADSEGYALGVTNSAPANGKPLHLMGIGGDELFSEMPAHVWTLIREVGFRKPDILIQYCLATRTSFWRGFRELTDSEDYVAAMKRHLDHAFLSPSRSTVPNQQGWVDEIEVPSFLTKKARDLAHEYCRSILEDLSGPLAADRARHQAIESLLFQARVTGQLNEMFGHRVVWDSPFLDLRLIEAALSAPMSKRSGPGITKKLLYEALKGLVPRQVFTRPEKGEYSVDSFAAYRRSLPVITNELSQSHLADLGLIEIDSVQKNLSFPAARATDISSIERLTSVERWIRRAWN